MLLCEHLMSGCRPYSLYCESCVSAGKMWLGSYFLDTFEALKLVLIDPWFLHSKREGSGVANILRQMNQPVLHTHGTTRCASCGIR